MSKSAAHHRLGHTQNFLRSPALVRRLIEQADLGSDDLVLEIGAGRGIITEQLADRCGAVLAVEKDEDLAAFTRARLAGRPNVRVISDDFLDFRLPRTPYKVFASIPFDLTAAIVARLTTGSSAPEDAYLVVQKEAAQRFAGEPRATLPSVLLKPWFDPTITHRFRRTDFTPVPRVDAVMLRLRKRGPPLVAASEAQEYRDFVAHCFAARRPILHETLRALVGARLAIELPRRLGIPPDATPSRVPFESWLGLFVAFRSQAREEARRRIRGAHRHLLRQQARLVKVHRARPSPAAPIAHPPRDEIWVLAPCQPGLACRRVQGVRAVEGWRPPEVSEVLASAWTNTPRLSTLRSVVAPSGIGLGGQLSPGSLASPGVARPRGWSLFTTRSLRPVPLAL